MAEGQFRVVMDGIGPRTGTVAGRPISREEAMDGFATAVQTFGADIAAGELRVSVLAEDTYQARRR